MRSVWDLFPKTAKHKLLSMKNSKWEVSDGNITVSDAHNVYTIPFGTKYKIFETKDFGWCVVERNKVTETWNKRIFKY